MTGDAPSVRPSARVVDPRLELPFDQYQRYEVTSALLAGFKVAPGSLVLEVGGGPGPLESFLPDYELFVSDISGAPHERFLLADGSKLPFADDTFAVAVTLDVLEHVPPQIRAPFLAELLRVSSDLVVLSAPFAHPDLELAEEALNEFIRARFQGDFPTLDEHADNGLPELGRDRRRARRRPERSPRPCRAAICRTGSSGCSCTTSCSPAGCRTSASCTPITTRSSRPTTAASRRTGT